MTYRDHAEEIAATMAACSAEQERDEILREQFNEDISMTPSPEVTRQRLKFERTPIRKTLVAAYLLIVLAGLLLGMTLATHVAERTAATVSGAHIKAMY